MDGRVDYYFNLTERGFEMKTIKNFFGDETGLELSEYAIAAALVVVGIGLVFSNIGAAIKTKITQLGTEMGVAS